MMSEYQYLFANFVVWAILLNALMCYTLLIDYCFIRKKDEYWYEKTLFWREGIKVLLSALPLLGLLGTISGLLKTFASMSRDKGFGLQELVSGGIAEAMFTTQLGLVMVVPGLLMHAYLVRQQQAWLVRNSYEIRN